jgi:integrase/recombinase XerC
MTDPAAGVGNPDRATEFLTPLRSGCARLRGHHPDFELTGNTPVVTLAARLNKSRKVKVQPIPADVAAALVEYLAGKPAGSPIWGGGWAAESRGADMLRIDLETAGIPYAVEGPDG